MGDVRYLWIGQKIADDAARPFHMHLAQEAG